MASDPLIVAADYLHQIPFAVSALADARTTAGEWRMVLDWLADCVILLLILKSRLLPWATRALAPRLSRPWLLSPFLAVLFALILEVARALAASMAGLAWPSGASPPAALLNAVPLRALGDVVLALVVLTAAGRWPRGWWIGIAALAALLSFIVTLGAPMLLPPAARGDRPVVTPQAAPLLAFARKGGLDAHALYVFDGADPTDVDAEGLGPIAHLAVSRAALDAPQPETYAALGHLLGHHRHKDLWSMSLLLSALAAVVLYLGARLTAPLAHRLGEGGVSGPSDPKALPVLGLILWLYMATAGVTFDAFDRWINDRADAYALSLTHDPKGMARWLIHAETKSKADPAWPEMVLFYDHPPLQARLERAFKTPAP
jgi:Zn-dependent protease with chaperone function